MSRQVKDILCYAQLISSGFTKEKQKEIFWSFFRFVQFYGVVTVAICCVFQSDETKWQKVEYLLEFAQWMYCAEYPIRDVLDQTQWAVDVLLSMNKHSDTSTEKPSGCTPTESSTREHEVTPNFVFPDKH